MDVNTSNYYNDIRQFEHRVNWEYNILTDISDLSPSGLETKLRKYDTASLNLYRIKKILRIYGDWKCRIFKKSRSRAELFWNFIYKMSHIIENIKSAQYKHEQN